MSPLSFIDLHQDLLSHIRHRDLFGDHWQTSFEHIERSNARIIIVSAYPRAETPEEKNNIPALIEREIDGYHDWCATHSNWKIIRDSSDIDAVMARPNAHGLILHIEGVSVAPDTARAIRDHLYKRGVRSVGLVHTASNAFGGGNTEAEPGLTKDGAELIYWIESKHMIVDFAHMNERTFWDVARLVTRPSIISHGNARAVFDNNRNYTDEQLRFIAERGGAVGAFFVKNFVAGREMPATLDSIIKHIDHVRNVVGDDHLAIGSDFGGILNNFVEKLDNLDHIKNLWDALEAHGYSSKLIEKVAYKNAARVLKEILK